MKQRSLLIGLCVVLLVAVGIVGAAVANHRRAASSSSSPAPVTDTNQVGKTAKHSTIDLTNNDDGRKIEMEVGDTITLTANGGATALDIQSGYDQNILTEIGAAGQTAQLSREIEALKAGQTTLAVILTAQCALPNQNPRCLVASRQLNLLVTVK